MKHDVIVVGAGIAGLAAAQELRKLGRDVIVVEARDRLGGRTSTLDIAGATVDLGGAWLHGPDGNPLTDYLADENIEWRPDGTWGHNLGVALDGCWVPQSEARSVGLAFHDFDPAEAAEALGPGEDVYRQGVEWYVKSRGLSGRSATMTSAALNWVMGSGVTGDHPEQISLRGAAVYQLHGGGNGVVVGGYRTLVDRLAIGLDVRASTPVSSIRHGRTGVAVQTADGEWLADHAIVTVPLGVLKAGRIAFDPPLPERQRRAIGGLGMKRLEKVVLRFEERFWPDEHQNFLHLSGDRFFSEFVDMTASAGAPVMVVFCNPAVATRQIGIEERAGAAVEILRSLLGDVPEPIAATTTDWSGDPYSAGAYSFIPLNASGADMDVLAEPFGQSLVLAGEHTVARYYGTVHAAFLSGRRAARQIADGR
jgi:monoamine oxidase